MNRLLAITGGPAHSERRTQRQRAFVGVLLVLCLLLAQWVGYAHAIAHAHGQGNLNAPLQVAELNSDARGDAGNDAKAGLFDHARASGACVALDASALGAGPCADIALLPVQRATLAPATAVLLQRWHPPFTANFATRAPPVNA